MIQFDKFFDPKSVCFEFSTMTKQFDNFFDQKMFVLNLVLWQSILTENMNFLIFQYFWTIQSKFFKSFQRNETPKKSECNGFALFDCWQLKFGEKKCENSLVEKTREIATVLRSPSAGNSSNSSSSSKRPRSTAFFSELIVKEIVVLVLEFSLSKFGMTFVFLSLQLLFSVNFYAWSGLPDNFACFAALRQKY